MVPTHSADPDLSSSSLALLFADGTQDSRVSIQGARHLSTRVH